jgi:hypothetical protein
VPPTPKPFDPGGDGPPEHPTFHATPKELRPEAIDFESKRPYFLWRPAKIIKHTFENTTRLAREGVNTMNLRKTYRTPFPALNVPRRNEAVATDTVYSKVKAIFSKCKAAQIFIGRTSLWIDIYPLQSTKDIAHVLQDNIRERGAMSLFISDGAQNQISQYVLDILRMYGIKSWVSEPHYQHQNYVERAWQTIKRLSNNVMNRTGCPANLWLLCLLYCAFVLNRMSVPRLQYRTPFEVLNGSTPDISMITRFHFYEEVYYSEIDPSFGSKKGTERRGWFVGFNEGVGHLMTFKILTRDTREIIYRSQVRSAVPEDSRNLRLSPPKRERVFIRSRHDGEGVDTVTLPTFDPDKLVGRTFLRPPEEDGSRYRVEVVEALADYHSSLDKDPTRIKF